MVSKMGMLDTIFALVFPGLVSALGTFLLRQAFMSLPRDLEGAAQNRRLQYRSNIFAYNDALVRSGKDCTRYIYSSVCIQGLDVADDSK